MAEKLDVDEATISAAHPGRSQSGKHVLEANKEAIDKLTDELKQEVMTLTGDYALSGHVGDLKQNDSKTVEKNNLVGKWATHLEQKMQVLLKLEWDTMNDAQKKLLFFQASKRYLGSPEAAEAAQKAADAKASRSKRKSRDGAGAGSTSNMDVDVEDEDDIVVSTGKRGKRSKAPGALTLDGPAEDAEASPSLRFTPATLQVTMSPPFPSRPLSSRLPTRPGTSIGLQNLAEPPRHRSVAGFAEPRRARSSTVSRPLLRQPSIGAGSGFEPASVPIMSESGYGDDSEESEDEGGEGSDAGSVGSLRLRSTGKAGR